MAAAGPSRAPRPRRASALRRRAIPSLGKTLILTATYNECETAPEMVRCLRELALDADILFVDDDSPDGTGTILEELRGDDPRLFVLHRPGKLGVGGAHFDGIQWAYDHGYDTVIALDCDFQHSPADIPRLIDAAEDCDVVVGSRFLAHGSLPRWYLLRKLLTHAGHLVTRLVLKVPWDATGSFRVYRISRIPRPVFSLIVSRGYAFFFESLAILVHNGVTVREVPIVVPARSIGHSKLTAREAWRSALRVAQLGWTKLTAPSRLRVTPPSRDAEPALPTARESDPSSGDRGDDEEPDSRSVAWRAERTYAAVALLLVALLHAALLVHGGALWRDEINSVAIARAGSWTEIVSNLEYDSFPAGWFALIRPVAAWFSPTSALAWRVFGVVVGCLLAAAVTLAGIAMTGRAPVLAINLALLSAIVIRFGDSVRGYGAGALLAALAYWALFRYAQRPTRASAAVALAVAVASVQLLYHNAFIVFGVCCAAAVGCLLHGARRAAAGAIAIGGVAAASLIPYVQVFRRARAWNDLLRWDIDLEWIHRVGAFGIRQSGAAALALWYVSLAVGLAVAARAVAKRSGADPRLAFHATALVLAGVAYVAFLRGLSYYMAPWYFLSLLVVAAMACDALVASITRGPLRLVIVLLLSAQLVLSAGTIARYVARPATNVPETAASIARQTHPGDLVLVTPWELGISWKLYYEGTAKWSTIPLMPLLDWHRFDLYRAQFGSEESARAIVRRIDDTLASGRRVLVVTWVDRPVVPGPQPAWLTRETAPPAQVNALLKSRGYRIAVRSRGNDASEYERVSVFELHAEPEATYPQRLRRR